MKAPRRVPCPACGKLFVSRDLLESHYYSGGALVPGYTKERRRCMTAAMLRARGIVETGNIFDHQK